MKKSYPIIISLSCLFLMCSCFPEKSSSKSSQSNSTSTSLTSSNSQSETVDYSDNPYIQTGSHYSNSNMHYYFNPNGTGSWEIVNEQGTKETHEFTYTISNNTLVNYVLKDNGEQNVGGFNEVQSQQVFVCRGINFYRQN